ncbi:MAG: hypothetical protein ABH858_04575 [Candidatus Omnitrophota bacterium]
MKSIKFFFGRWVKDIENHKDRNKIIEFSFVVISMLVFIFFLYDLLIAKTRMFAHDAIWYHGLMHYFYDSMMTGVFPYWTPYEYCGQPIYYSLGIARVFEIPTVVLISLNKFINASLLTLYHWDFILRILIISLGVYLCFRQTNRYLMSSFVVLISFLFSSFSFASMWQCGLLTTFIWTPWAMLFLLRLRKQWDLYNMVGFSLFTGMSITSYQAGYVLTFLGFFALTFLIMDFAWCKSLLKNKKNILTLCLGMGIITLISLQALAIFIEKDEVKPVIRLQYLGLKEYNKADLSRADDGSLDRVPSRMFDFAGLLVPMFSRYAWDNQTKYPFSEAPLYIGIFPLMLAVIGMAKSKQKYKINFLVVMIVTFFLMLDGKYAMGLFGNMLFPFLKYARHMQLFQPFLIFTLIYFTGQGTDVLIARCAKNDQ